MPETILRGGTALLDAEKILTRLGIAEGMIVADLGCGGGGHFVAPASRLVGRTGHVYAVDIQKAVLHTVESKLRLQHVTNVDLVWSDLEKLGAASIPSASCDLALVANVLFQNKDHAAILSEALRFIKQGTILAVLDWKKAASPLGPSLDLRIDPSVIKELGIKAGATFVDEFDPGAYHTCLVFRKN
ncbi:MAG: class I SAM-dependent methyltransferase [Patescibacteria group bacterium]